mmetsp:Transcript_33352/g.55998  ORF Transcript_33352/g.55998 Transcript_33352/m.55998 type:complete len:523 (-) Transcript_33352:181-1749(-)
MSNNLEDDGYNDDYSEGDAHNDFHREADDEQHAQKVNGKLEALQSEINSLGQALSAERDKRKELMEDRQRLEAENSKLQEAVNSLNEAKVDASEIERLKMRNEKLTGQLDEALSLSPDSCPPSLKQEFIEFCKFNNIYPELKDKDYTVEMCAKILKSQKSVATGSGGSASVDSSSMFSSQDSMTTKRIKQLEHELRVSAGGSQDIKALRSKVIHLNERVRIEKEYKYRAEAELGNSNKKIGMLSGHMEKLVVHLKHEGAHKLRIAEQLRVSERENNALKEKCDLISRKSSAKDRLVLELREGSKVLEDQLRLMDEKYMELRTKLDYARELGAKKIKKAEKTAADLRVKFALANGSAILDAVPLPPGYQTGGGGSMYSDAGSAGGDHMSWRSGMMGGGGDDRGGAGDVGYSLGIGESGMMMGGINNGGGDNNNYYNSQEAEMSALRASTGGGIGGGGGGGMHSRKASTMSVSSSVSSLGGKPQEPNLDRVLEKIRQKEGRQQDWTQEKVDQLLVKKKKGMKKS